MLQAPGVPALQRIHNERGESGGHRLDRLPVYSDNLKRF